MDQARLQSIIISRFFLDLRQAALMPDTVASSPSQMSDVNFSRVLGNLGGSLALSTDGHIEDADDEDEGRAMMEMYEIQESSRRSDGHE